jgi:UrcA family protein
MHATTLHTRILGIVLALAGTTGLALSAHAGAPAGAAHTAVVVRYADLNLTSPEGAKALYARLDAAAEKACGGEPGAQDFSRQATYRACYERAMNKAVEKVGRTQVQALHAARATGSRVG